MRVSVQYLVFVKYMHCLQRQRLRVVGEYMNSTPFAVHCVFSVQFYFGRGGCSNDNPDVTKTSFSGIKNMCGDRMCSNMKHLSYKTRIVQAMVPVIPNILLAIILKCIIKHAEPDWWHTS